MYSRSRVAGFWNGTPCQCSTTFAPELPSPMIARPPESSSSVPKVIPSTAGVRLKTFTIAVPSWIFFVLRANCVSMLKASRPHASATQTDSTPRSSAIWTRLMMSSRSAGLPANPICKPSRFVICHPPCAARPDAGSDVRRARDTLGSHSVDA